MKVQIHTYTTGLYVYRRFSSWKIRKMCCW